MKVLIGNAKDNLNDDDINKRLWRVPYRELVRLGWKYVLQEDLKKVLEDGGGLIDSLVKMVGERPAAIVFWNTNTLIRNYLKEILEYDGVRSIYADDIHQLGSKMKAFRDCVYGNFEFVFATYGYCFGNFYPEIDLKKVIWFPHGVPKSYIQDFNLDPVPKILLSGCVNEKTYPMRYRVAGLAGKYPIASLKHCGYGKPKHQICGEEYVKYLGKYLVAFTCCSYERTPYIVSKFFEIPASGALLLAYDGLVKAPLAQLGFVDGVHYVAVDDSNLEDKIKYVLDEGNREEINLIRKQGWELVQKRHLLDHRAELLDQTVQQAISEGKGPVSSES